MAVHMHGNVLHAHQVSCSLSLAHLFQSYARTEIGLHWLVGVLEFVDKARVPIMIHSRSKDSSTSECTTACLVRSKKG